MTGDEIWEWSEDPDCPFTYEELFDMVFGRRGESIYDIIAECERELNGDTPDPK